MGFFKFRADSDGKSEGEKPDESIYQSNEKIDRNGETWEKKAVWFRKEYLGKLKVIAHFEDTKTDVIVDRALRDYFAEHWDKSQAVRKLVKQSADKGQKAKT